jgi:hypothetical protein
MTQKKLKNGTLERKWLYSRWFACLIGVMVFIGGMAQAVDIAPASLGYSPGGIWTLLFGPTSIIFRLIFGRVLSEGKYVTQHYQQDFYFAPTPPEYLWSFILVVIISVVVVLIVRLLQRRRRSFKWLVYIHLVLYVGTLTLAAVMDITASSTSDYYHLYFDARCEKQLADNFYIRLDYYDPILEENSGFGERNWYSYPVDKTIVYTSQDAGQTWQEVVHLLSYDRLCIRDEIKGANLEQDSMWFWTEGKLFYSHNNGKTWQYWLIDQDKLPLPAYITEVAFTDHEHGTMTIESWTDGAISTGKLKTSDGGQSWQLVVWRGDFGN